MEVRNFSSELFGATFSGPCTASLNGTCVDKLERIPLLNSLYAYIPHSIFTAVVGVIVYWLFTQVLFDRPPPKGLKHIPGPRSTLPYLGRIHDVDRYDTKNSMKKFNDIYNGLFIITLGGEKHIWVGREDIAFDLLCKNAAICSGRADLGAYPSVTKEAQYLPLLGYNENLIRQRKFAHQIMTKNVTNQFYGYISLEVKRYLNDLLTAPDDFFRLSSLFCGHITARLAYGSPEGAAAHVRNAEWFISQLGPAGPVTNLIPFLQRFPEWLVPAKKPVRLRREQERELWISSYQRGKKAYESGNAPASYVSAYLENNTSGDGQKPLFPDEMEAIYTIGMMCTVAIFTIGGVITLFAMAMVLHPEWQEKVREEIDAVTKGRLVELSDSPQLPTLRAALKECLRWRSTVPLGVPRLLEKDYEFQGYHFPKDAVVHVLDVALARNPKKYPDADTYNPGRWLNPEYPTFQGPLTEHPRLKGHHIFGSGRRICPGPDLAEAELLVVAGNLVSFYELKPKVGPDGSLQWPDPNKWTPDVIGGPLPFEFSLRVRDAQKEKLIQKMYQESFPQ